MVFRCIQNRRNQRNCQGAIDTSLLTSSTSNVLRTYAQGPIAQNGGVLRYDLPLADGQYNIRLIFLEPTANGPNQRKFDIALQGQTVLSNFDIFADTAPFEKPPPSPLHLMPAQGSGLQLTLTNRLPSNAAILSAIEITQINPLPSSTFHRIEFSSDDGASWTAIGDVPVNRFGESQFVWNATTTTSGNTGRFRATVISDGVPSIQKISSPFSISNTETLTL